MFLAADISMGTNHEVFAKEICISRDSLAGGNVKSLITFPTFQLCTAVFEMKYGLLGHQYMST